MFIANLVRIPISRSRVYGTILIIKHKHPDKHEDALKVRDEQRVKRLKAAEDEVNRQQMYQLEAAKQLRLDDLRFHAGQVEKGQLYSVGNRTWRKCYNSAGL